ncbi:hypothetical protein EDB83DRAFT_2523637 [Lactarius deliciosus]|nr:hypothetical protein EDB83DRAFT_2523637 [Lactarius deliciosus]
MLRIPFPSTGTENVTLYRGRKRARRDALKDLTNSVPVTILKRPIPLARQQLPPPPVVKILTNPERQAATAPAIRAHPYCITSPSPAPTPVPNARSAAHVSFAIVVPGDFSPRRRGGDSTAPSVPKAGFRPERMVRLPKVIIHAPVWWDQWTDVHHPGTSYGEMLDVPPLNWRGKMDSDDLARYYPKERAAERILQMLRHLERGGTGHRSRRHGRSGSCQKAEKARSKATPAAAPSSALKAEARDDSYVIRPFLSLTLASASRRRVAAATWGRRQRRRSTRRLLSRGGDLRAE